MVLLEVAVQIGNVPRCSICIRLGIHLQFICWFQLVTDQEDVTTSSIRNNQETQDVHIFSTNKKQTENAFEFIWQLQLTKKGVINSIKHFQISVQYRD